MRAFSVTVAAADEDEAVAALWEAGTAGVEVKPAGHGRVRLLAYFESHADDPPAALLAASSLMPAGADVEPVEVEDVDWVARFREGFHSFRAGRFVITPAWESAAGTAPGSVHAAGPAPAVLSFPAGEQPPETSPTPDRPSADVLIVDPGRAFGTGTHETTRLCLSALEALAARRRLGRTLDLGAGTGLLSVAAVRLGASFVCASDLDREATTASRHHARLNAVRLGVVQADGGRGFRRGSFDLVLANLMALLLVGDVPFVRAAFEGDGAVTRCGEPSVVVDGEWAALAYENCP